MSGPGIIVAYLSPLTYLVDGLNASMGQSSVIPWAVDILVLVLFMTIFTFGTRKLLQRNLMKGM
jgi:ABC-type multidrug transport system permease subunit